MRVQPIIDRLGHLGFKQVGGALEYAAIARLAPILPAAFVVPQDESAGPNRLATGGVDQRMLDTFAVVLLLPSAARRDATADELLDTLGRGVKDALGGWTHPDGSGPVLAAGGALVGVDANALVWALRFTSPHHLRKVS